MQPERKRPRGDGIFGWPISGFTIALSLIALAVCWILQIMGKMDEGSKTGIVSVMAIVGGIIEWVHYKITSR